MTLKPGIRLGPYEILSPFSVVGPGDIYRGRDHKQGRDVVVRVLRIWTEADPALLPRLAAYVLEAGALMHPAIPKIYDVGTTADTIYIVCEPFDGETLRALVDRYDLAVDAATEYITQVASVLAIARKQRVSHRDLRAEKVLLTAAAAQSERDEMPLYLETAIQMEVIQSAAGLPGAPLVSATEIAGDLSLQVDRYEDARQVYADAADRVGPSLRIMVVSARASSWLKDVLAACTSYESLLDTWGTRPGRPFEIAEARTYIDNVCASAEAPG